MKSTCAWSSLCVVLSFAGSPWPNPIPRRGKGGRERISKAQKAFHPESTYQRTGQSLRTWGLWGLDFSMRDGIGVSPREKYFISMQI
jgi:hypothetical protein